jgi:inhibitor of cysteine peptidase
MDRSLVRRPAARAAASVIALAALLAFVSVAAGCGGAVTAKVTAARTYSEADNGRTVTLAVGDPFTVTLKENPTTGCQWNMVVGKGITLVSDQYTQDAQPSPGPALVGAGGTHAWSLKATTAGTWTLTGAYARAWAPDDAGGFTLTVVVK